MKYNEDVRDDSSSAGHLAKGAKGFSKAQGLPHAHTNLMIDLFNEDDVDQHCTTCDKGPNLADISVKKYEHSGFLKVNVGFAIFSA